MTMTALPKADSYVIGSAPCERAPGGRVFFDRCGSLALHLLRSAG